MLPLHGHNTAALKFSVGRPYFLLTHKRNVFGKQSKFLMSNFFILKNNSLMNQINPTNYIINENFK